MVLIFFADGFEEVEALTPCDYLRRAGVEVCSVSMNPTAEVLGAHGIRVVCDILADEALKKLEKNEVEMVVFPGGKVGVDNLDADSRTDVILDLAKRADSFVTAICAGPSILGKRGLLAGKKAICYPGFEEFLSGAEISEQPVVRDGKIITAKAAGVAAEFSFCLIEALCSAEAAKEVSSAVFHK